MMIASVPGVMIAAPMPWITRMTIKAVISGASPQSTEAPYPHWQHSYHQHIPRNCPGNRPQRRTKIMHNGRQCDIDNKKVDVEHEQTKAGCNQRQPFGRHSLSHEVSSRSF